LADKKTQSERNRTSIHVTLLTARRHPANAVAARVIAMDINPDDGPACTILSLGAVCRPPFYTNSERLRMLRDGVAVPIHPEQKTACVAASR
jgi:hypothetical protein